MRALPTLLLGAVAYVAFLVGTVPATLVTGEVARVAAGRVEFDQVEGTAWNGRAAVRLRSGGGELSLDEVAWRFLPANLFAGEAAFAIQAKRAGLDAAFVVARSPAETRLREAHKLGFSRAIVPAATARQLRAPSGLAIEGVASVSELWQRLFGGRVRAAAAGNDD